jgi:hypothetical protein
MRFNQTKSEGQRERERLIAREWSACLKRYLDLKQGAVGASCGCLQD